MSQTTPVPCVNHGFLSSDKTGKGYIRGLNFAPKEVEYAIVDGMAVFEGDIILGPVEQIEQFTQQIEAEKRGLKTRGIGITGQRYRWPHGNIPYQIDSSLTSTERVTQAIAHWEANTNIRFIQRTAANAAQYPNFITFRPGSGCSSDVGMQGGEQFINLAGGCDMGRTVHEIGHAVGLWHEQSREDRDTFVTVNFANIEAGKEHNFNQHISDGDDIGTYDYGSIMHYPRDAFTNGGGDTIVPAGGQAIGQRTGLSAGDIAAVRALYPNLEPSRSWNGVQFRETVAAGQTRRWFTHSWPAFWYVWWTVVPTSPVQNSAAQLSWRVQAERQTDAHVKYFIAVTNHSGQDVQFEARYEVLGWTR